MNKKSVISLYKKEMLDILRDKKTIIMMILVPLILYPLMIIGVIMLVNNMAKDSTTKTYNIVTFEDDIKSVLENSTDYRFKVLQDYDLDECEEALKNKSIDAYITVKDNVYSINYISSLTDSSNACDMVSQILDDYKNKLIKQELEKNGLDMEEVLNPIVIETSNKATSEETAGSVFGYMVPMLLVISILLGALYPAIDATAGERERGTLETLMTLPISKLDMMISKFMAVSTVAVVSAILNIISMTFVTVYIYDTVNMYADSVNSSISFVAFIPAVLIMILCIVVFAMFSSAICLCVCLFAKSFKEANNYCTPVLLLFTFASMAPAFPSIEFNTTTAALPVINISLLVKEIFVLHYNFDLIMIVLVTNMVYSMVAVIIMSKLFDSEEVLFGQGLKGTRLFEKRCNMKDNQIPAFGDNVLLLAVILLFMFFVASRLIAKYGLKGMVVFQVFMLILPIVYAWYIKADLKKLFFIKKPHFKDILSGIFIWIGALCMVNVVTFVLNDIFPSIQSTSDVLQTTIISDGFVVAFIATAILPALAEEVVFRGFLFGTLANKINIMYAIFISALIFGLYHMNLLQFVAGFIIGSFMAFALYKSGSIWISIVMHFLNNGLSVVGTFYPDSYSHLPIISKNTYDRSDILILILVGIICLSIGIALFKIGKKH